MSESNTNSTKSDLSDILDKKYNSKLEEDLVKQAEDFKFMGKYEDAIKIYDVLPLCI